MGATGPSRHGVGEANETVFGTPGTPPRQRHDRTGRPPRLLGRLMLTTVMPCRVAPSTTATGGRHTPATPDASLAADVDRSIMRRQRCSVDHRDGGRPYPRDA